MNALLRIEGLRVAYGRVVAVHNIDLEVPRGHVVALLGPNGAGKTSLLTAIAGTIVPAAGCVRLGDTDITGQPAHRLAVRGLRLVPEGRALFPDMSIADNLAVGAPGGRLDAEHFDRIVEVFPVLGDRRSQQAGTLSGGEQQQLAIGRALIGDPDVLLLDEPSMGLAPRIVADIMRTLKKLTEGGLSVLLAEQNANAVLDSVGTAVVMDRGVIVARGSGQEVREVLADGYLAGGGVR